MAPDTAASPERRSRCTDICADCAGEGKIRVGEGSHVCYTCHGTGLVKEVGP